MNFWQRALILVLAMMAVSYVFGMIWNSVFGMNLPDYAAGVVGGLTAVPVWDLLRKVKPKPKKTENI